MLNYITNKSAIAKYIFGLVIIAGIFFGFAFLASPQNAKAVEGTATRGAAPMAIISAAQISATQNIIVGFQRDFVQLEGRTLSLGVSGKNVVWFQEILIWFGAGNVAVDGFFREGTGRAWGEFQMWFNLSQTGVFNEVGRKALIYTFDMIDNSFNALGRQDIVITKFYMNWEGAADALMIYDFDERRWTHLESGTTAGTTTGAGTAIEEELKEMFDESVQQQIIDDEEPEVVVPDESAQQLIDDDGTEFNEELDELKVPEDIQVI